MLYFNGVRGDTGRYAVAPTTLERFAGRARARGAGLMPASSALDEEIDPCDLSAAGWGVVFSPAVSEAARQALAPLLELRREQATRRDESLYRELTLSGPDQVQKLARLGSLGGCKRCGEALPYYLLLVGDPESLPFPLQYELDIRYAVGRIHFETPEEYAVYAESVVRAERGGFRRARRVSLVGVRNPDDPPTKMSLARLVRPVAERLQRPGWEVETLLGERATKAALAGTLGGPRTPALVMTAGHAVCYEPDDPRIEAFQGGLVCADWPGPRRWSSGLADDHFFAARDVPDDADVGGVVSFHFACYSAGTPSTDAYCGAAVARRPFVARLPQRLLAHPRGGALAVIGHVDRAMQHSFLLDGPGPQPMVFSSALERMLDGAPVGHAMDCFGARLSEIAAGLDAGTPGASGAEPELQAGIGAGKADGADGADVQTAQLWTAFWDSRSYVVLGDPAVRLAVAGERQ